MHAGTGCGWTCSRRSREPPGTLSSRRPASPFTQPAVVVGRDERLALARLDLLHRPRVAVGIAEAEERTAVGRRHHHQVADLYATVGKLLTRGLCIRDH